MNLEQPIPSANPAVKKKVGLWAQVALTFFIVSGGAYGLESAVGAVGAKLAFLLVLTVPLLWAIPISLVVAELSTMLPQRGGYYIWVRRALGDFWGFQEGWWTIAFSAVDLAIYPVLFVTYLSFFFPQLAVGNGDFWLVRWLIGVVFICFSVILNWQGSRFVGASAVVQVIFVLIPFILLTVGAIYFGDLGQVRTVLAAPFTSQINPAQIAAGLAIVLWNYSGWDNISTFADEVQNPGRVIPRSLLITIVLVFLSYALPMLAGFSATVDAKFWGESSGWPEIASRLLGQWHGYPIGVWLGAFTAATALISAWALFNSQLLYISRLPAAMADDGFLHRNFSRTSARTGVPTFSLICAAAAAALFCGLTLGKLMVVDVLLGFLGLSLEFVALIVLRKKEPATNRPFRIPLGIPGLIALSAVPAVIALVVAGASISGEQGSFMQIGIVAAVAVVGVPLYYFSRKRESQIRADKNLSEKDFPATRG